MITTHCMRLAINTIWFYQKADFDAMNDALEDSLPPESVLSGGNVNSTWSLFKRAFIDTVNRFVPSKLVSYREKLPPWLTSEVRRILSKRDRARQLAKHTDAASDWSKFRYLRNLAVSAVRGAKRHFFNSINCSGDYNKSFWKGYHSLSTSASNLPSTLTDSSTFASSSLVRRGLTHHVPYGSGDTQRRLATRHRSSFLRMQCVGRVHVTAQAAEALAEAGRV